jgi:hypothetical protein
VATVRKFVFTLAAITLPAAAASSQSTPLAPVLSADSIITRYYHAVGGYEKIKAVASRRMLGSYSEGVMTATTEILWRRPMLRRVNIRGDGFDYSEGFDGYSWTFDVVSGKLMRDAGGPSDASRRGAEFDESIVDYRDKGSTATLLGTTKAGEINAYRLRIRLADGWEKDYLIDTSSFLIVAVRQARPAPAPASTTGTYSMYEDWRVVSGLRVPFRFVEKDAVTGKVINTLQWKDVAHNVKITDAQIKAPAPR